MKPTEHLLRALREIAGEIGPNPAGRAKIALDDWDKAREGTVAAERSPKEEPLKRNDHGADCMRYLVAHLDLAPKPRMRGWL